MKNLQTMLEDESISERDKAYALMHEVRKIAEHLGCDITEDDFSILDKIDAVSDIDDINFDDEE